MSNPNPFIAASAPELIAVLQAAQQMVTTICTGDPATIGLRVGPALQVFAGTVGLQLPALATAELGTVGNVINAQLGNAISKLQAAVKS